MGLMKQRKGLYRQPRSLYGADETDKETEINCERWLCSTIANYHRNLSAAGGTAVCHGVMSTDFTKVAAVHNVIGEAAVNQPRLVKVRMSGVDVGQLDGYQILYLSSIHSEDNACIIHSFIHIRGVDPKGEGRGRSPTYIE